MKNHASYLSKSRHPRDEVENFWKTKFFEVPTKQSNTGNILSMTEKFQEQQLEDLLRYLMHGQIL